MMRKDKSFQAVLSKMANKVQEDNVVVAFDLKHTCPGEVQNFLHSFADSMAVDNVKQLFQIPVQWKAVQLDGFYPIDLEFGDVPKFSAILNGIKVSRSLKKGDEVFTYTLQFTKEQEGDVDPILANFLNYKEIDENGKKTTVLYDVFLSKQEKE